ncbi:MAG: hypothetical protein ABSF90_10380 [Syntrophobacteraceae bacterium]|jgi:hypothetical protein
MELSPAATEKNRLKGTLLIRGLSLETWAIAHGYKPVTVRMVVRRHWGEADSTIHGLLTHEILTKLQEEMTESEEKSA